MSYVLNNRTLPYSAAASQRHSALRWSIVACAIFWYGVAAATIAALN